ISRYPKVRRLSQIKDDLDFYTGFEGLIDTWKTVALMEFRALEKKTASFDQFGSIVERFFKMLSACRFNHPFVVPPEGSPVGVVVVTSDGGLSGGLDRKLVMGAASQAEGDDDQIIVIGRQGDAYLQGTGRRYLSFPGVQDDARYQLAAQVLKHVAGEVLAGRLGVVKVVYAKPLSIIVQKVVMIDLLPCTGELQGERSAYIENVIFESTPDDLVEYLAYLWVGQKLYEIFGLARLAEVAARFMHAEDSLEKVKEINKKFELEHFRVRHEIVDQQMREIAASRSA
ncbi:F0F1 ATP synthase subunit gamma, partial [Planctomycetota bacterium]